MIKNSWMQTAEQSENKVQAMSAAEESYKNMSPDAQREKISVKVIYGYADGELDAGVCDLFEC